MRITVEFYGLARQRTGEKAVTVELEGTATARALVALLAERYPPLIGPVIGPECDRLVEPHVLNVDGRTVVHDLDRALPEGKPVCLMFVVAGG